uniref:IKBKB interacting protein n=1 Tax=Sphenodon punctatus TaxID=8508 RepID=A0A8D0FXD9_SPHPU
MPISSSKLSPFSHGPAVRGVGGWRPHQWAMHGQPITQMPPHLDPSPRTEHLPLTPIAPCLGNGWSAEALKLILSRHGRCFVLQMQLESSESILQEATSSISLVIHFEKEVSHLRSIIHNIQNTEQTLSKKMQSITEKFQNFTDFWNRILDEMNININSLKSEAKLTHTEVTSKINTADQKIKSLTGRLKDLEHSTIRNMKTLKIQEEDELSRVEHQLDLDKKAVKKLEQQQDILITKDNDLSQKLTDYEPKVQECKTYLPTIESAVHSVVRVSSELVGLEKKMENLTKQIFNMEDEMLKAVSEIMDMQKVIDGMQYDNSILKLQNEIVVLKEKVRDTTVTKDTREEVTLEDYNQEKQSLDGEQ